MLLLVGFLKKCTARDIVPILTRLKKHGSKSKSNYKIEECGNLIMVM